MGSEVACAIRGLRPEFSHIDKTPFLHETVDTVGLKAAVKHVPVQAIPSAVPAYFPPSPAPSAESSTMAQRRTVSGGKFQFWYIGKLPKARTLAYGRIFRQARRDNVNGDDPAGSC
jgi:hypothetical protein